MGFFDKAKEEGSFSTASGIENLHYVGGDRIQATMVFEKIY